VSPQPPPADQTLWLLAAFVLFFTLIAFAVSVWLPANDKFYAVVAGQVAAFAGALLLWLKPRS
jgi:hypothetical protein